MNTEYDLHKLPEAKNILISCATHSGHGVNQRIIIT